MQCEDRDQVACLGDFRINCRADSTACIVENNGVLVVQFASNRCRLISSSCCSCSTGRPLVPHSPHPESVPLRPMSCLNRAVTPNGRTLGRAHAEQPVRFGAKGSPERNSTYPIAYVAKRCRPALTRECDCTSAWATLTLSDPCLGVHAHSSHI